MNEERIRGRGLERLREKESSSRSHTPSAERGSITNLARKVETLENKMRTIMEKVFPTFDVTIEDQSVKTTIDEIKYMGDKSTAPIDETIKTVKDIWDECELIAAREENDDRYNRYNTLADLAQNLHASLAELDKAKNDHCARDIYEAIDSLMNTSDDQSPHYIIRELQREWENLKVSSHKTDHGSSHDTNQIPSADPLNNQDSDSNWDEEVELLRGEPIFGQHQIVDGHIIANQAPSQENNASTYSENTVHPGHHPSRLPITEKKRVTDFPHQLEQDISYSRELANTYFGNQALAEIFPNMNLDHINDPSEKSAYLDILYHYAQALHNRTQEAFQQDKACKDVLGNYEASQIYYKWYGKKGAEFTQLIAIRNNRDKTIAIGPNKNSLNVKLGIDIDHGPMQYPKIKMQDILKTSEEVIMAISNVLRPLYKKKEEYKRKTGFIGLYFTDNYAQLAQNFGGDPSKMFALYRVSDSHRSIGPWTLPDGANKVDDHK